MKYLVIILLLGLMACGKQQGVLDTPDFRLSFPMDELSLSDLPVIMMSRENPEDNPMIQLSPTSGRIIKELKKQLHCGPLKFLAQTTNSTGDWSFRLSESEFPGITSLPRRPPCQLQITAIFDNDSVVTRTQKIVLYFEAPQLVEVTRHLVKSNAWYRFEKNKTLTLEKYLVTNTLNYPLGILYLPEKYEILNDYGAPTVVRPQKIKFAGEPSQIGGDFIRRLEFVLLPGKKVELSSVLENTASHSDSLYVKKVSSQSPSLRFWLSFEPSDDDVQNRVDAPLQFFADAKL